MQRAKGSKECEHKCGGYSFCLRTFLGAGPYFRNVSESHLSGDNHSATLLFVLVPACLMVSVMSEGSNSSHSRELLLKNAGGFSPVVTGLRGNKNLS